MKPYEIDKALKSIVIVADTREQETEQYFKRMKGIGFPFIREKLDFCDYTCKYTDNEGVEHDLRNEIGIERKMSLDELCSNFCKGRARFEREFERARDAGCKVHLIVENGSIGKIVDGDYRSKLNSNSLLSSLIAFADRYDITYHFSMTKDTPLLINKIFTHHVRNKLYEQLEE